MGKRKKDKKVSVYKSKQKDLSQLYTVVVPVFDDQQADWMVQVALDLAKQKNGRVVIVGMVLVPSEESLSTGAVTAQERRATLDRLRQKFSGESILIKRRVRVVHETWKSLTKIVAKEKVNLAVVPWARGGTRPFFAMELDDLLSNLNCHVVVVAGEMAEKINHILLPIRGSQEAPLMLEVSLSIAKSRQADVTMLYSSADDKSATSQQAYNELARMVQGNPLISERRVTGNIIPAIKEAGHVHQLIVMGISEAPQGSELREIGQVARYLQQENVAPLLVVKTHRPPPVEKITEWQADTPLPATFTAVTVDRWFAENTFSSQEFKKLEKLVEMKTARNLTISLGLPALNEEETIEKIIQTMQDHLMDRVPLLDEIVLIDSGSTDYTVDIAQDLGIPVYQHSEILPQYGSYRGKGEALWKSLHVLKGDIIAWIDTDIVNIHPRFVYGVLGPLIQNRSIQYVKGFYRRPLKVGDTLQAGSGGRVTELVARPLFNLFYPELSGIMQPLSGEYAGRREALEQTPFYVGYGVETGLLLDLVERYGISGIAQVDLRQRVHHNQSLGALSRMAFAIIQVFIDRLESRQRVELLNEINRTMKIIRYGTNRFSLEEHSIRDQCRPPIVTLPEYRQKHNVSEWREREFVGWLEQHEDDLPPTADLAMEIEEV